MVLAKFGGAGRAGGVGGGGAGGGGAGGEVAPRALMSARSAFMGTNVATQYE